MDLKLGYFANAKKYKAAGYKTVNISLLPPGWYAGLHIKSLAPNVKLLQGIKSKSITQDQYTEEFRRLLADRKLQIIKDLKNLESLGHEKYVFLCYEKTGEFCHRNIVAEYLKPLGYELTELIVK